LFAATGRDPFHADNVAAVMHRVLSADPDLSCLPESLRPLVVASLSKTAGDRPSARELLLGLVGGADGGVRELLAAGSRTAAGSPGPSEADPSLGELAERVYGELDQADQAVVPAVFLRLVSVDDDSEVALRRAGHAELLEVADGRERVLSAFVAADLLVRDGATVALARPALLTAWPRLREWLEVERAGLPAYRRLAAAVRQWEAGGRRSGDLAQGSALRAALRWAATGRTHLTLTAAERAFLDAGTDQVRRTSRRRRAVTGALAVLLVFSAGISVFADQQRRTAEQRRTQVAAQRDRAAARSLAATADGLRRDDPRRAMLLNVAAWRIAPQQETEAGLHSALTQPALDVSAEPPGSYNYRSILSGDGRWAAALLRTTRLNVGQLEVHVRDLSTGRPGATIRYTTTNEDGSPSLFLAAGGRLLAGDGRLWDVAAGTSSPLAYGPSLTRAVVNAAGDVLVEKLDRRPMARRAGTSRWVPVGGSAVHDMVLSDSVPVAALQHGNRVELWNLTGPRLLSTVTTPLTDLAEKAPDDPYLATSQATPIRTSRMALTADGEILVGLDGRKIRFWNTADGQPAREPLTFKAIGAAVSPAGDVLAAWNVRQLRFWRMSDLAQLATWTAGQVGSPSFAEARFWEDGRRLSVSDGHTVRVLDVSLLKAEARSGGATLSATFASDGRSLAIRQASRRDEYEVTSSTFHLLDMSATPRLARRLDTETGGHRYA
ncbi:MAG: hypothetical protein HOY71_54120, partial [Nonomuraea sp.]|nr:hypothetical protein [Nonomuraea sp.]